MSELHTIPELDAKGLRRFALTMCVIICILFGLAIPFLFGHSWPIWPWLVGMVFLLWGTIAPLTLCPVYHVWMRFGLIMSKITTPLILGILFYLILTPAGLIMRIFNKDPMARKFDKTHDTYRRLRDESIHTDFEKPY